MSEDETEVPNQHAKADPATLRLSLTLEEEVVILRARVTELQARGTEQLVAARAAAFEAASRECDAVHREIVDEYEYDSVAEQTAAAEGAQMCGDRIKILAQR